jgi:hypothetical protein
MLRFNGLHPLDRPKVQSLAERFCAISAGRLMSTAGLEADIGTLMVMTLPSCSPEGADQVLARIFKRADHRLGSIGIVDIILEEIGHQGALQ